jgi:hypothetical protein
MVLDCVPVEFVQLRPDGSAWTETVSACEKEWGRIVSWAQVLRRVNAEEMGLAATWSFDLDYGGVMWTVGSFRCKEDVSLEELERRLLIQDPGPFAKVEAEYARHKYVYYFKAGSVREMVSLVTVSEVMAT